MTIHYNVPLANITIRYQTQISSVRRLTKANKVWDSVERQQNNQKWKKWGDISFPIFQIFRSTRRCAQQTDANGIVCPHNGLFLPRQQTGIQSEYLDMFATKIPDHWFSFSLLKIFSDGRHSSSTNSYICCRHCVKIYFIWLLTSQMISFF